MPRTPHISLDHAVPELGRATRPSIAVAADLADLPQRRRRRAARDPRARRRSPPARRPRRTSASASSSQVELGARHRSRAPPRRTRPRGRRPDASWASESSGAARQRNCDQQRLGGEVEVRGAAADLRRRGPGTRSRRATAPARRRRGRASPSRQRPGTVRTSGTSPTQPTTGAGVIARPSVSLYSETFPETTGDAERLGGQRHPLDRLDELPRDLALLRVAEVEAVGQPERLAAGAGDVPRRLEHGERAAGARCEAGDPARPVERDGEPAERRAQPQHRRVEAGTPHGARADELVVALVDPRAVEQMFGEPRSSSSACARGGADRRGRLGRGGARRRLDPVAGRLVGEEARRGSRRPSRRRRSARRSPVSVTSPIGVQWSSQRRADLLDRLEEARRGRPRPSAPATPRS